MGRVLESVPNKPGTSNSVRVGVFRVEGNAKEQVGEYLRNYSTLLKMFCHFRKGERDFALYSPKYTVTRIMELPSCRDLGGEEDSTGAGFCPADYYVPSYVDREYEDLEGKLRRSRIHEPAPEDLGEKFQSVWPVDPATGNRVEVKKPDRQATPVLNYEFGFVAGCVWGDDGSWKIQYLDLSGADKGIVRRDDRFGHIELPDGLDLRAAINMYDYGNPCGKDWSHHITIAVQSRIDLRTGKVVDPSV